MCSLLESQFISSWQKLQTQHIHKPQAKKRNAALYHIVLNFVEDYRIFLEARKIYCKSYLTNIVVWLLVQNWNYLQLHNMNRHMFLYKLKNKHFWRHTLYVKYTHLVLDAYNIDKQLSDICMFQSMDRHILCYWPKDCKTVFHCKADEP